MIKRPAKSIRNFAKKVLGNRNYDKFVVISRSRSGSTLLMSLLNGHPNVRMYGEKFQYLHDASTMDNWNAIFGKELPGIGLVGFKIFYYHPLDSEDRSVWELISRDKSLKIVHLVRENLLEIVLSREKAGLSEQWNSTQVALQKTDRIKIDPEFCRGEFEKTVASREEVEEMYGDKNLLTITYEELRHNPNSTMADVFQFLGVQPKKVETKLRKQNTTPVSDSIENYTELKRYFEGSQWSGFFKD